MRLLLLASGALLPVSVMVALLVAAFAHVLPEALWTLPQITTSLATVAATASVVQGRKRVRTAAFTFDVEVKPSGPRWFAENASLAVDDRGLLVITDGQGLWHRLETARSTSGPKAISTVIFSDQNGGAALLIDGTGTVRLQLSAALWYPDGAEGLRNVFHAIGILTKIGSDQRDSPDVALGLLTHVEEPKRSLAEQNDLCVARVTPLAGGVLFPASPLLSRPARGTSGLPHCASWLLWSTWLPLHGSAGSNPPCGSASAGSGRSVRRISAWAGERSCSPSWRSSVFSLPSSPVAPPAGTSSRSQPRSSSQRRP